VAVLLINKKNTTIIDIYLSQASFIQAYAYFKTHI